MHGVIRKTQVSSFDALMERWRAADSAAWKHERQVSDALDRYVEGTGPAPALLEIEQLRSLRAEAVQALRELLACVEAERRKLPPL